MFSNIINSIQNPTYKRQPLELVTKLSKQDTKTLMIARYGMLECGKNFKGTLSEICNTCYCPDDEEHRLNICQLYCLTNHHDNPTIVKFDEIFSDDINIIKLIISRIETVWNVTKGHGSMN